MGAPVLHNGEWWFQHENGAWSRWDATTNRWVPYAANYPTYPTPVYSSIAGISRWVIGAIALDMVVSLIIGAIGFNQAATSARFAGSEPEEFFQDFAAQISVFNLINIVWTASGIVFVIWFYRAYQNLSALRTSGRFGTGWALGAWLVPILNLFRPKQIADDIWRTSEPTLPENPGNLWVTGKVAPIVHGWWAAWIGGSFLPLLVYPFVMAGVDMEDPGPFFARFFGVMLATMGTGRIVAGAFAIPVVKQMTERQERRATALGVSRGTA